MGLLDLIKKGKEMPVDSVATGTLTEDEARMPQVGAYIAGSIVVETAKQGHSVTVRRSDREVTLHKYAPK